MPLRHQPARGAHPPCPTDLDKLAACKFSWQGWRLPSPLLLGCRKARNTPEPPADRYPDHRRGWRMRCCLFFGTITKRAGSLTIYVVIRSAGACIIAIVPCCTSTTLSFRHFKCRPIYSGAVDAMVQWWYGTTRVGFPADHGLPGRRCTVPKVAAAANIPYRLPSCT
jgi:hypothetical protein